MPQEIHFKNTFRFGIFGPAIILLAFGQATGELIHWPNLVLAYGALFMAMLIPACLLQLPILGFLGRHTVLTGESHFPVLLKIRPLLALIAWVVFVLTSIWIASYTASGGIAIAKMYSVTTGRAIDLEQSGAIAALILNTAFMLILLLKQKTYKLISVFMTVIAAVSFASIVILFIWTLVRDEIQWAFLGALFDLGRLASIPEIVDPRHSKLIISAFVFAGLGGLWNVLYSVWVRQEALGSRSQDKRSEFVDYQSELRNVDRSTQSVENYKRVMGLLRRDLWIGVAGNTMMIVMIAYIVYVCFPKDVDAPSGVGIITALGDAVSYESVVIGVIFYVAVGVFLIDTWIAAVDTLAKLHSNFCLGAISRIRESPAPSEIEIKRLYVAIVVFMWGMTFVSSFFASPQQLIFLNGILSVLGASLLSMNLLFVERAICQRYSDYPRHRFMKVFLWIAFFVYTGIAILFMIL